MILYYDIKTITIKLKGVIRRLCFKNEILRLDLAVAIRGMAKILAIRRMPYRVWHEDDDAYRRSRLERGDGGLRL